MHHDLPHSPACERNKDVIFEVFSKYDVTGPLFEMGFGTAQHAFYLAEKLPQNQWYAFDQKLYHSAFLTRLEIFKKPSNLFGPYEMEIGGQETIEDFVFGQLGALKASSFFTANTLHIMNAREAQLFCQQVGEVMTPGAWLFIYGPFKFKGEFTSESNAEFDANLRARGEGSGIRNFEDLKAWLDSFEFKERHDLPANNHMLVFKKL